MSEQHDSLIRGSKLSPAKQALLEKWKGNAFKAADVSQIIPKRQEKGPAPLSFAQQRLWFLDQLVPGSPAYNVPAAVRLTGSLNVATLKRALDEVIRRHEILRTSFSTQEGQPVQVISESVENRLPVIDLRDLSEQQRQQQAEEIAREESQRAFELSKGPMMRARLVRVGEQEQILVVVIHHIVSDGWSVGIMIKEMAEIYERKERGEEVRKEELKLQYADYAVWQREYLRGEVEERLVGYWKKQLKGVERGMELGTDRARPPVQSFRGALRLFEIDSSLTRGLKEISRREGVTLFVTMLAAFKVLLHRYTGQDDIVIGTPAAGRSRVELEGLIGFFVNTLVLRTDLSGDPSFKELLIRERDVLLDAHAHQDIPFERLIDELQVKRDLSRNPMFQIMFIQNPPNSPINIPNLKLSNVETHSGTTKFDMSLSTTDIGDRLVGSVEYSSDLYDESTIERLIEHFENLLAAVVAHPEQRLSNLSMMTGESRRRMLIEWNDTATEYPNAEGKGLHHLIEAQ
ncbi:MAG TPA: condensation domain-containing protein, partial [Blastocatellia bacterium]